MQQTVVGWTFMLLHRVKRKRADSDGECVSGRRRGLLGFARTGEERLL